MSTPFPQLATKFITLEVTRVAERGFVTLEGLLDQEIASVIHKDFSHTVPTSSPGSLWGIFHTDTTFSPNSLLLGFSMQLNPGSLGAGWCGSLPGLSSRFVSGCLRLSPFVCGSGSWLAW